MIDTKKIFVVTYESNDKLFEVSMLCTWIKRDLDNWLLKRTNPKSNWLMLAAFDNRKAAYAHMERLEKSP